MIEKEPTSAQIPVEEEEQGKRREAKRTNEATRSAVHAFRIGTIRTRLFIAFVLVVLLLAVVVGTAVAVLGFQSAREQATRQLEAVATLKEGEIKKWMRDSQTELISVLNADVPSRYLHWLSLEDSRDPLRRVAHQRVQEQFRQATRHGRWFRELALLDPKGEVVVATDRIEEGENYSDQIYFQEGLSRAYMQPPSISPALSRMSIVFTQPVEDREGRTFVLVGRSSAGVLEEVMLGRTGLGETMETYIVNGDYVPVTPTKLSGEGIYVQSQGVDAALAHKGSGSALYDNYWGRPVVGVYHWLPELQAVLMAEQEQSEAFRPTYTMLGVIGGIALAAVLVAMAVSLRITRSIATPLASLAETATQIAAGDLGRSAEVRRRDEIGALGLAFNSMTDQLRELISSLERRVAERTRDLERRVVQLQAAAEVGHAAASIRDLDELLLQVMHLISQRFGFYHVGVFLLDEAGEYAVLRAANSDGGQRMLDRGHRLRVREQGIVGYVTGVGKPRIALDVGEDNVHFRNPDLPDTRSEIALPLVVGGRVLGALDVQSTEESAFTQEDIEVLQVLADQVAVAIENARLFANAQGALEAAQRAYGGMSQRAWEEILRAQPELGFRSDVRGVTSAQDVWRPEMEKALRERQTVQLSNLRATDQSTNGGQSLAVPIKVRGQVVGVLDTYKPEDAGQWTPEEIATLESITEQLGAALESARLYQDTQRRATRERLTREITDELRRATSAESIVQTAVDELFRVLGTSRAFGKLEVAPPSRGTQKVGEP